VERLKQRRLARKDSHVDEIPIRLDSGERVVDALADRRLDR
jgi:hypothetical protein